MTPAERATAMVEQLLGIVESWQRKPIRFGGPVVTRDSGVEREPMDVLAEFVAHQLGAAIAEEREACAKIAEVGLRKRKINDDGTVVNGGWHMGGGDEHGFQWSVRDLAAAIRARP